ncbi:hypothetical protein PsYK624_034650 [Phanerochaete sordida]|uniref:Methyltransferase domain-containing protein n=1 Tax=Phanerochaete sordida TaxID=48140 RepID=A0A9P3G1P2_9APHY|nr:hypothetical protein PsYK624_034650 [Phanerochaete sordida]
MPDVNSFQILGAAAAPGDDNVPVSARRKDCNCDGTGIPPPIDTVFRWGELPANSRIVDIGDALGMQSVILAIKFPSLCYVIQDVDPDITTARRNWASQMHDFVVSGRVRFRNHSGCDDQPVKDAAVFIVHFSLDCLSDTAAVTFMGKLREVAQPQTNMVLYFNRGPIPDSPPESDVCPSGDTESPVVGPQAGRAVVSKAIAAKVLVEERSCCRCRDNMELLVQQAGWKIIPSKCVPYAPANQTIIAGV